jgi:hypothetical protein
LRVAEGADHEDLPAGGELLNPGAVGRECGGAFTRTSSADS